MLLACLLPATMKAQQAGDVISGNVYDEMGGLMMVNVVEKDANNRIVAAGVTDINGNFSFRIVNPKDKLHISYVGYQTVVLPIDRKVFKVQMKSATTLKEVVVKATRKSESSGLAIPVTEISVAQQRIDMKEFEGLGITSVDEALQGRVSGLDIVANSGNLGAGTTMRLRGVSSINGNSEPLIVVNGNVWNSDANKDFDYTNANEERFAELLNVNPEDIESITVLKDAAATVIWGSQGSNGVIEIKTKRGQKGKTRVQYSYRLNGLWQPSGMRILNGDDYTMYLKEAYFNPRLSSSISDNTSADYMPEINYDRAYSEYEMYNNNTDWRDEVKQFGVQHSHYVALTGGGEKARFRISGGYDDQGNSVIKQKLNRFTTRVALDYYVSDRITVSTNFDMTYTDNKHESRRWGEIFDLGYRKMPNLAVYEEDQYGNSTGNFYAMLTDPSVHSSQLNDQLDIPNPVAVAHLTKVEQKTVKLSPEFILKYDLLGTDNEHHRLTYEGRIIFDVNTNRTEEFIPTSLTTSAWTSEDANSTSTNSSKTYGISTTHTLTFIPHFNNTNHSLMSMLRAQYNTGNSSSQGLGKYGLPTSSITSPLAAGTYSNFSNGAGEWKSNYYTFSTHYAYKGKYMLDFSCRVDGSTQFGPDKRWGFFPGLSGRWNISDEKFMEKLEWLTMLSIRPGWGYAGNPPGSEGLFYSKYGAGPAYMNQASIIPNNIRLAGLRWEKKETWNLGFDLGLFNDKITADLSIYTSKVTDLRMNNRAIPSSTGYDALSIQNTGSLRNNGWEFNIFGKDIVKKGDFSFGFNITFANSRNEILTMDETILDSMNDEFGYGNGQYLSRVQLHNPLGSIYGFRYKGVYQYSDYTAEEVAGVSGPDAPIARNKEGEPVLDENGRTKPMMFNYGGVNYEFKGGDAKYEDINHDGNIDELDIVYLGSTLPQLTGGFGFKFKFKSFSLNTQFNYRFGQKVINLARMNGENMYNNNNQTAGTNWRWRKEGDITEVPRALYNVGYNWLGSDRFVEEASFLRLNYVQLRYDVPSKVLKPVGITALNVYLTLNNVFCITKYSGADPEHPQGGWAPASDNSRTPRSKSFTLGATIQF